LAPNSDNLVYIVDGQNDTPFQEEIFTELEKASNESKEFEFLVEIDDNQSNVRNEYTRQSQIIKNYPLDQHESEAGKASNGVDNNIQRLSKLYMS
jgi:hypothetical protein